MTIEGTATSSDARIAKHRRALRASVANEPSMVPVGRIMPAPFADAGKKLHTVCRPQSHLHRCLWDRVVALVIMRWPLSAQRSTRVVIIFVYLSYIRQVHWGSAANQFWRGRASPITPVENGNTCCSPTPATAARARSRLLRRPDRVRQARVGVTRY